jgi:tRNA-2-methylthio-N6-dimethylallyladenosine synthase
MKNKDQKFHLLILGCQMNQADGERIVGLLKTLGYTQTTEEKSADLIIAVACSVRQTAIDRVYGKAREWNRLKKKKKLLTVLTGCVLDTDRKKLSQCFDLVLPITEINKLTEFLREQPVGFSGDYLDLSAEHQSDFSAFVPISNGCNNFCSYCAVPYTRGRETHRSAKQIIAECQKLIKEGYKEIVLLGQNVNSYKNGSYNFPKLLKEIDRIKGDYWLRFFTSHPKDLSEELIETIAEGKHLAPHLHLALQSGDNQILKKMNRRYTAQHFLSLIKKTRKKIKNLSVSTDVIVGFPGENQKQFNNTLKLMREVGFDLAYINKYSPRPQTKASDLIDNVTVVEKKSRAEKVNEVLIKGALKNNKKYLGLTFKVLVDGYKNGRCFGKTENHKIVYFKGKSTLLGKFVPVKINKIGAFILEGELA